MHTSHAFTSSTSADSFNIFTLVAIARKRWKTIVAGMVLGVAAAVAYCFVAQDYFESKVQILVMAKDPNLPTRSTEGMRELSATVAEDLLATHMQLLTSPIIVQRALETRKLDGLPSIVDHLKVDETPVEYVIRKLELQRGGKGRTKQAHILTASLELVSPEDSAAVLNAIVESYQDFLGETFQDTSSEAVQLIVQAKGELEKQVADQEDAYTKYLQNAPVLWQKDEPVNIHLVRATELERALTEARIRQMATKSRLDLVEKALADADARNLSDTDRLALIDDKDITRLELFVRVERPEAMNEAFQATQPARAETARSEYESLVALHLRENAMALDLGPDHPRMQEAKKNIAHITNYLAEQKKSLGSGEKRPRLTASMLTQSYIQLLKNDLADFDVRIANLEAQYKAEEVAAKKLVEYEVQGKAMANSMVRKQELYDAVVNRLREITLVKDYGGYVTEVVSPAMLGKPSWPKLPLTAALGGLLGLLFGSGAALTLELTDKTYRNLDEVQASLGLPLMACVPDLRTMEREIVASQKKNREAAAVDASVLSFHRPKSREAEAVRGLRTSLRFSNLQGEQKVIQVSSALSGDGKTTVAANLAVSLAQSGKRVLLVDADLRRPSVDKLFQIDAKAGLSNVIIGDAEVVDAIQATPVANLWILPSGPIPPNPAELLGLPQFEQFLEVVRRQYDYVIIDSPPLLAVSDPLVVAPHADGMLLVVRFTKNGRPAAERARELASMPGISLLGVVVNGLGFADGQHYGYGASEGAGQYFTDESAADFQVAANR